VKPPAIFKPGQLEVYQTISRIRMAWTALIVVFGLFTVGFGSFLYALFFINGAEIAKGVAGGVDLLLAWAVKVVLNHLFPGKAD